MTKTLPSVDEIYEDDGGELGSLMGWLLYDAEDLDDVEQFLATEGEDYFPDGVDGGWDVEEVYVRKVPAEFGWRYVYGAKGRGARRALKVEQYHFWGHHCHNHPLEGAVAGIPPERVADAEPLPGDQYVYLCRPCRDLFCEREREARAAAVRDLQGASA